MHQDVYSEKFEGEGAPNWAVCTNGVPSADPPGRWSLATGRGRRASRSATSGDNNVRGRPAGPVRRGVGRRGARLPREPLGPRLRPLQRAVLDRRWSTSTASTSTPSSSASTRAPGPLGTPPAAAPRPLRCPTDDPAHGVVPTIQANDPAHLIFDEPDNYGSRGDPTYLGPMQLPNLVFNVHLYCGARSPVTGNPTDVAPAPSRRRTRWACARRPARDGLATPSRAGRPGWSPSSARRAAPRYLERVTAQMDAEQVGWIYWSWKYYGDPTGSNDESLVHRRRAAALDGPGAQPGLSPSGGRDAAALLVLAADRRLRPGVRARTTASMRRRSSSCRPRSTTGTATAPARPAPGVTSAPGSDVLDVQNARTGQRVTVRCHAGALQRAGDDADSAQA